MVELRDDGVLVDRWRPVFRHSAGRLGSQYLTAIRTERRLRGWRTGQPERTSLPPKNFGDHGEWVDVGPGATLLAYVPAQWIAGGPDSTPDSFILARVAVDGADAPIFALLKPDAGSATPKRGDRLTVRFAAEGGPAGPDLWFEPAAARTGS